MDDWKERKLTYQWSAEVLHEDTLNKWTYLHAVALIGAWSAGAAPANKMLSASMIQTTCWSFTSLPFPLSFQHPLSVFFWPHSCFWGELPFIPYLTDQSALFVLFSPRSAGNARCIFHPLNLTSAGDVRHLCRLCSPHLHHSWAVLQGMQAVFFQHLVFMRAVVCVYVRSI